MPNARSSHKRIYRWEIPGWVFVISEKINLNWCCNDVQQRATPVCMEQSRVSFENEQIEHKHSKSCVDMVDTLPYNVCSLLRPSNVFKKMLVTPIRRLASLHAARTQIFANGKLIFLVLPGARGDQCGRLCKRPYRFRCTYSVAVEDCASLLLSIS